MGMFSENRPLGNHWGGTYTPYVNSIGEPLKGPYWTMPYTYQPDSILTIPAHNLKIDISALQTWVRNRITFAGKRYGEVWQPFAAWPSGGIFSLPLIGSAPDSATWFLQFIPPGATYAVQIEVYFAALSRVSPYHPFNRYNLRVSTAATWYHWYGSKVEIETPGPLGLYRLYTWPISLFTSPSIAGTWNALPVNGFAPVELTITEDV